MNLDNLKPAWRQFQLVSSMRTLNEGEILLLLETAEAAEINKTHRLLMHAFTFIVLILCCQGG
jgi:hypothetical protein